MKNQSPAKIKEAILAFRITQTFSKDRILELYLNDIYLGMGSYGVSAAGEEYFGKDLKDLSTEEVALLAAMPKAPAYYDPRKNYDAALGRRNYVINRMFEDGYINQAEAENAKITKIVTAEQTSPTVSEAPFFAEEIRRELSDAYGVDNLYKGGLYVLTTLDPELQHYADDALRSALTEYDRRHGYRGALTTMADLSGWDAQLQELLKKKIAPLVDQNQLAVVINVLPDKAEIGFANGEHGTIPFSDVKWAQKVSSGGVYGKVPAKMPDVLTKGDVIIVKPTDQENAFSLIQIPGVNGALVAMEPRTGRVLAMTGGYSFDNTVFNRATQAKRQPGSAFKAIRLFNGIRAGIFTQFHCHGFTDRTFARPGATSVAAEEF